MPIIEQLTIQPNLMKNADGKIIEFFSIQVSGYDKDGAEDIVLARISHPESGLFWHLDRDKNTPYNFTSSFLQGPSAMLPRGEYIIELFDAAGHTATKPWSFAPKPFTPKALIFPNRTNLSSIDDSIYLFIYNKNLFVAEYKINPKEEIPLLLENEVGYLYYFNRTIGYGLLEAL